MAPGPASRLRGAALPRHPGQGVLTTDSASHHHRHSWPGHCPHGQRCGHLPPKQGLVSLHTPLATREGPSSQNEKALAQESQERPHLKTSPTGGRGLDRSLSPCGPHCPHEKVKLPDSISAFQTVAAQDSGRWWGWRGRCRASVSFPFSAAGQFSPTRITGQ